MKIAVMASPETIDRARTVMTALKAEGLPLVGLRYNDGWRNETRSRIDDFLSAVTHILCVVDTADTSGSWLAYIVGLARGRGTPLALYNAGPSRKTEAWLADAPLFDDPDRTVAYFRGEAVAWAVKEGRRMAKAALLELGISWHAESLAQCVRDGDTKAVELFIASGFPPDVRDKAGVPMLCLAARSRHVGIVELLLDKGANIDAQSDDRGYSALMDAAQQGDDRLLEILLARHADPDLRSKDGQTALVLAVGRSDATAVERLLRGGADPDIADKLGLSARKYAKLFHDPRIDEAFSAIAG